MATMRAELADMIQKLGEEEVQEAFDFVQKMLYAHTEENEKERQKERDIAFERLEKSIHEYKHLYGDDYDWKKEYAEALNEKYGVIA